MFHAAKAISPASEWQFGKRPLMLQFDDISRQPNARSRSSRSHLTVFSRADRHRAMKPNCLSLASAVMISLTSCYSSLAKQPLPRSTPEAQGVSSEAIQDFVSTVDKINTLHSFMLVRHGQVVAEGWW